MIEAGIRYYLDKELKVVHLWSDCVALKMAKRYGYQGTLRIASSGEAVILDMEGYRPCHRCWKKEQYAAKKEGRRHRPGFFKEPRK